MATNGNDVADFVLTYHGPAVESGRMPVRDLAPALLALGDLFREAHDVADPMSPPVSLDVRAFDRGSFDIALQLGRMDIVTFLTNHPGITAVGVYLGLVTDSAQGAFAVLRFLQGRLWSRARVRPGVTRITTQDGDTMEVPEGVAALIERGTARKYMRAVVQPLREEGVESLTIEQPDQPPLEITEADAEAFEVPPGEPLVDESVPMLLTVLALSFVSGNSWRFSDGTRRFYARMDDVAFFDRVQERRDLFGAGDVLQCIVRIRQWEGDTPGSIRTEWSIERVVQHQSGGGALPGQLSLPDTSSE